METTSNNADFPWRRNYMPPFREMLERLRALPPLPIADEAPTKDGRIMTIKRSFPEDYENTDSLTDWDAEPVRILCREKDYQTPAEAWRHIRGKKNLPLSVQQRRECVYERSRGCNLFNIAFGIYLLRATGPGDVLDPCAGWGDRLGAAFVTGASSYRGWDTNPALQDVYPALATRYEKEGLALDWRVTCAPFETVASEELASGFDTVLTSPPFYDKELYEGLTTSTSVYKTVDVWYEKFYRVIWEKAAAALRPGGRVIAYISRGRMFREADSVLRAAGLRYVGRVGFLQTAGAQPMDKKTAEKQTRDAYIWRL